MLLQNHRFWVLFVFIVLIGWISLLPASDLSSPDTPLLSTRAPDAYAAEANALTAHLKLVEELNASRAEVGRLRADLEASLARAARLVANATRLDDELASLKAAAASAVEESTSISGILAGFQSPWWRAAASTYSAYARQEKWVGATQSCRHVRGPRKLRTWAPACDRDILNIVFWQVPYNADPMSWRVGADSPRVFDEPTLAVWADSVLRNIGLHGTLPAGMVPDNEFFFPPKTAADENEFDRELSCNIPGRRVRASFRNRAVLRPEADVVLVNYPFAMSGNLGLLPPSRDGLSTILMFTGESTEYYPHVTTPEFQARFDATIGVPQSFFTYAGLPDWPYTIRGAELAKRPSPQLKRVLEAGGWPKSATLVATMVSNCQARNDRTEYIEELMKFMRVDSFGSCAGNAKVDDAILARHGFSNDTKTNHFNADFRGVKHELFAGYPFVLSFENANCYDWVTEKPYDALLAGAVPVYMGAPNVNDYLPTNSYIDARFFSGPAELAAFLMATAADPVAYGAFHAWREEDASAWPWMDDAMDGESLCSVIQMQWDSKCGTKSAMSTQPQSATPTATTSATAVHTASSTVASPPPPSPPPSSVALASPEPSFVAKASDSAHLPPLLLPLATPQMTRAANQSTVRRSCSLAEYTNGTWLRVPENPPLLAFSGYKYCAVDLRQECRAGVTQSDGFRLEWTPRNPSCALRDFSALEAKECLRNERVLFLGDSLSRNMYQSLQCMLLEEPEPLDKVAAIEMNDGYKPEYDLLSPQHNLSIKYRNAQVFTPEILGVDSFEELTLLIASTGAWWQSSTPRGYGEAFTEASALFLAREAVAQIIARMPTNLRAVWRLPDIIHAYGSDKEHPNDPAGCRNLPAPHPVATPGHAEDSSGWKFAGPSFDWIYTALLVALSETKRFDVMDVATLSGSRPDAHPSTHLPYSGHFKLNKTIGDCQHWCLGVQDAVPDAWNAILLNWLCGDKGAA